MKYQYATANDVPEALKNEYEERDGAFVLKVEELPEGVEIENIAGLRSALQKERNRNKSLVAHVAELEGERKTETHTLTGKVELLSQQNSKLLSALNEQRLTNATIEAIHEAKGNPALLRPYLEKHVKVDDAGKVQVVDDAGQPLLNKAGEPVSVRDFVLSLRETPAYMGAFAGSGHSGGGAPPSSGNGGTITVTPHRSKMSVADKAAYIREHGSEKFMQLPV